MAAVAGPVALGMLGVMGGKSAGRAKAAKDPQNQQMSMMISGASASMMSGGCMCVMCFCMMIAFIMFKPKPHGDAL